MFPPGSTATPLDQSTDFYIYKLERDNLRKLVEQRENEKGELASALAECRHQND